MTPADLSSPDPGPGPTTHLGMEPKATTPGATSHVGIEPKATTPGATSHVGVEPSSTKPGATAQTTVGPSSTQPGAIAQTAVGRSATASGVTQPLAAGLSGTGPSGHEVATDEGASAEVLLRLVARLKERGQTLVTAESLTGGLVGAALTDVPGVSAVYRGGVVVYATDLKASLAGVPADLLADVGPVHPDTAAALATGVRERLGATYGLATTGVAGPDPQAGIEAGTVYIAAAGPGTILVRKLALTGDRAAVRQGSVRAVLALAAELVAEELA